MVAILFVRHSIPALTTEPPAHAWPLSDDGRRRAVELGRRLGGRFGRQPRNIVSSTETKAQETAGLLALGAVRTDLRLSEVDKPWYSTANDHRLAAVDYLTGHPPAGWETHQEAVERFDAATDGLPDWSIVVTHGTVWTLWLSRQVREFDPVGFWNQLRMPDAYLFDTASGVLERV